MKLALAANDGSVPFAKLMELEKLTEDTFRSTTRAYSPSSGPGARRAYGGHVYSQAVWAAAQTVKTGFLIHVCVLHHAGPCKRS